MVFESDKNSYELREIKKLS